MAFGDVVQSNSGTSTTATTAPTLGSATTAGNIVCLTFAADDYNGTVNTGWTESSEMEQQTFHGGYLWWLTATAAMTIPSYTIGSAVRSTWTLVEYEGPFDASPYDGSEGQFQQTSTQSYTTAALTPTAGDRLLVAGLQGQNASAELTNWSGFTNSFTSARASLYNGANPRLSIVQLRLVVTANGSTAYSTGGTATPSTFQSKSGHIIAFKAGAGGGGTTYNDTTAETASAAETAGGLLTTTKAVAETAASAETATGLLTVAGAVAEAAAAADSVNGLVADADALAWRTAVVANGGTVSDARFTTVSDFITAEKAAGTWALTDDYWGLWAENEPQALTSLKQRRLATAVAAPVHTIDRGYAFNGTSNYLRTGFIPVTHAVAMAGDNLRLAVYERTNVATNIRAGVNDVAARALYIYPRSTGNNFTSNCNSSAVNIVTGITDSRGFAAASRAVGASVLTAWKNGVALGTAAMGTSGTSLATREIYIGCVNTAGAAATFGASALGLVCVGASLTEAQEQAQYNNVLVWGTAVGAAIVGNVLEMLAANDTVDADVIPGEVTPEAPTQVPGAGPPGPDRRRFELYLLPEEDEDEKPKRKRRLRLKKAEIEEKIEAAVEYIEAGSPRPMAPQAMVAEVSTLMGLDALLEADRRRVERTIYQYLAAMLEEEEEEGVAMLLLAA